MRAINQWQNASLEIRNLFNPAFCGLVLNEIVSEYEKSKQSNFPVSLSYISLPLALNKRLRSALPKNSKTSLTVWISNNQNLLPLFFDRTKKLSCFVTASLDFMVSQGFLKLDENLIIRNTQDKPKGINILLKADQEINEIVKRSHFIGKWLARSGKPENIYSLLGVRP